MFEGRIIKSREKGMSFEEEFALHTLGWAYEHLPFSRAYEKLFKYGLNKERGCHGKKDGCEEFHPSLCRDSLKGSCSGKELQRKGVFI